MSETFVQKLAVGGKTNSLGRAEEVVREVLQDKSRLDELYDCLFDSDPWTRMRAADSLEKVCRIHPEWFEPYADRLLQEMGKSGQPSLQWHVAQMISEIRLTPSQQIGAAQWLEERLKDKNIDWIVASNAMVTLIRLMKDGVVPKNKVVSLIRGQLEHHSQSVRRRAAKLLAEVETAKD